MTGEPDPDEPVVMATIVAAMLAVAAVGAGWIWRQARRRHSPTG